MSAATMARNTDEAHDLHGHDYDGDAKERPSKGPKGSTKAKDLSHVPCRFFKAGACTAGASCPFSHSSAEPGQAKGVCQWYIKGNCKFGHKCALAHVLPGQPISMDRKNKRAEQQASKNAATANANASQAPPAKDRERGDGKRDSSQEKRERLSKGAAAAPSGLSGTAPVRPSSLSISSRPPMTIGKAAPTVSAIASDPAMHDTDFHRSAEESVPRRGSGMTTSFAAAVAGTGSRESALSSLRPSSLSASTTTQSTSPSGLAATMTATGRDSPLASSSPNSPSPTASDASKALPERERSPIPQARPVHRANHSSDLGFGPIGSPPAASRLHESQSPGKSPQTGGIALARARLSNGFSPPTSPPNISGFDIDQNATTNGFAASFSSSVQANSPSLFTPYGQGGSVPATRTAPLHNSSSLNEQHHLLSGAATGRTGASRPSAWAGSLPASTFLNDSMTLSNSAVAEEEDLEDFLPSSLNELLTPGERSRRMSRSNLGRPRFDPDSGSGANGGVSIGEQRQQQLRDVHAPQPRFVSSVPTASLLNNFRGIWDEPSSTHDNHVGTQQSIGGAAESWRNGNGVGGISGSFGRGGDVPSPSLLGTSNASAAFLPGHMHRAAVNGNALNRDLSGGISSSFDPRQANSRFDPNSGLALSPSRFNDGLGVASSPSNLNGGIFMPNPSDTSYYGLHDASNNPRQHIHGQQSSSGLHAQALQQQQNQYMALSPTSARALRAHEPGQSLPQGLAAGLSRLHLVPATNPISPPAMSASPSASISASMTSNGGVGAGFAGQQSAYGSWLKSTSGELSSPPHGSGLGIGGPSFSGAGLGMGGVASPPRFGASGLSSNGNYSSLLSRGAPAGAATLPRRDNAWVAQAQASPLSRPTVPDDNAMFDMD